MKHKIFRALLSLVLVCVLLISWSPIRARATSAVAPAGIITQVVPLAGEGGAVAGGATLGTAVFGYVLAGLGVIIVGAALLEVVDRYQEYSGELETSIYYYPDGTWSYGVDMGFVERVRAFLFDTGVVSYSVPIPADISYRDLLVSYVNNFRKWYPYCLVVYCGSVWSVSASEHPLNFYQSSDGQYYNLDTDDGGSVIRFATRYADNWTSSFQWKASAVTSYCHFGSDNLNSSELVIESDYDLGVIAPLEMPMPDSYPDWHTNARPATNPDTQEEITVLPIPLNPSADPDAAPDTLTQPDIWQGTIADPMPDTDTNPDTGTDTDPDTQPDSPGAPSTDIGDYQIDLKKFFPFCIPFDLYDFFSCLAADPVAPVIEWVIPLPGGDTYPLEIDLSAFDGVAQLLRRLQLLLFCVGLAFKTRDLIKG